MKDLLTNEKLKGLFKSNFELARQAIRLGKYYVKAGKEVTLNGILEEVRRNPKEDYVNQLQESDAQDKEENDQSA